MTNSVDQNSVDLPIQSFEESIQNTPEEFIITISDEQPLTEDPVFVEDPSSDQSAIDDSSISTRPLEYNKIVFTPDMIKPIQYAYRILLTESPVVTLLKTIRWKRLKNFSIFNNLSL